MILILLIILYFILISSSSLSPSSSLLSNKNHLIVLAHGIMGTSNDLNFLKNILEKSGCVVLSSSVNERTKSLNGIDVGGKKLAIEILKTIDNNPSITELSFVGNSLGGLYSRYAIKELHNHHQMKNIKRKYFMSISTPHLGVLNYTYIEQTFDITIPFGLKELVSNLMLRSGKHVFLTDRYDKQQPLLYQMATDDLYLNPLRAFTKRRLYANLRNDFVVPCEISSLLSHDECKILRRKNQYQSGIIELINDDGDNRKGTYSQRKESDAFSQMLISLDNIGWSKVLVNFPGFIPNAHNKICALQREPQWFWDKVMGTEQGKSIMNNAAEWLLKV